MLRAQYGRLAGVALALLAGCARPGSDAPAQAIAQTPLSASPSTLLNSSGNPQAYPLPVASTQGFLVTWEEQQAIGWTIMARTFDATGCPSGPAQQVPVSLAHGNTGEVYQGSHAVASDGTRFLVVDSEYGSNDLWVHLLLADGSVGGLTDGGGDLCPSATSGGDVALCAANPDVAVVASNGQGYLVAWNTLETPPRVGAAWVSADGVPSPAYALLGAQDAGGYDVLRLAAQPGGDYLLAWSDVGQQRFGLTTVHLDGGAEPPTYFTPGWVSTYSDFPSLIASGSGYLMAWTAPNGLYTEEDGVTLQSGVSTGGAFPLASLSGLSIYVPSASYDGTYWLIAAPINDADVSRPGVATLSTLGSPASLVDVGNGDALMGLGRFGDGLALASVTGGVSLLAADLGLPLPDGGALPQVAAYQLSPGGAPPQCSAGSSTGSLGSIGSTASSTSASSSSSSGSSSAGSIGSTSTSSTSTGSTSTGSTSAGSSTTTSSTTTSSSSASATSTGSSGSTSAGATTGASSTGASSAGSSTGSPGAGSRDLFGCASGPGPAGPGLALLALLLLGRRRRLAPALALAAALAASPARAEAPKRKLKLAVLDLQTGKGLDPSVGKLVAVRLASAIQAASPEASVVSSADVQTALGMERTQQLMGCTDSGCLAELSGALGVDLVVAGLLSHVGHSYTVDAQLLDLKRALVRRRYSHRLPDAAGEEAFLDEVDPIVAALFPEARPAAPAEVPGRALVLGLGAASELTARGGLLALRVGYDVLPQLELRADGVLTAQGLPGVVPAVAWLPVELLGRVRPELALGAPLLFARPVAVALQPALGAKVALASWLDVTAEVPVMYFLTAPPDARRAYLFGQLLLGGRL